MAHAVPHLDLSGGGGDAVAAADSEEGLSFFDMLNQERDDDEKAPSPPPSAGKAKTAAAAATGPAAASGAASEAASEAASSSSKPKWSLFKRGARSNSQAGDKAAPIILDTRTRMARTSSGAVKLPLDIVQMQQTPPDPSPLVSPSVSDEGSLMSPTTDRGSYSPTDSPPMSPLTSPLVSVATSGAQSPLSPGASDAEGSVDDGGLAVSQDGTCTVSQAMAMAEKGSAAKLKLAKSPRRGSKAAQAVAATSNDILARSANDTASPSLSRFGSKKLGARRSPSMPHMGADNEASVESEESASSRDSGRLVGSRKNSVTSKRRGSKGASGEGVAKKDLPANDFMAQVIVDVEAAAALRAFMQASVCEENIEIVFLIHEFRLAAESRARRIAALITSSYLLEEAPRVVNVDSRTRAAVLAAYREHMAGDSFQPVPRTVFDLVFSKICALIITDVIPRFFSSPQFTAMKEGTALRRKVFGDLPVVRQRVWEVCSLAGWARCDHESVEVEMWETSKGSVRGCTILPFPPSVVAAVLMDAKAYREWIPTIVRSESIGDHNGVFRLAQLTLLLDERDSSNRTNMSLAVLELQRTLYEVTIAWQSCPAGTTSDGGAGKTPQLEMEQTGFTISAENAENSSRVVFVSRLQHHKKYKAVDALTIPERNREFVVRLLSALQPRCRVFVQSQDIVL